MLDTRYWILAKGKELGAKTLMLDTGFWVLEIMTDQNKKQLNGTG